MISWRAGSHTCLSIVTVQDDESVSCPQYPVTLSVLVMVIMSLADMAIDFRTFSLWGAILCGGEVVISNTFIHRCQVGCRLLWMDLYLIFSLIIDFALQASKLIVVRHLPPKQEI